MDHQMVFIGGLQRSGTTLFHSILASHPEISGFQNTGALEDEGGYLQDVFDKDQNYGGPGRMAFDPACHMTEDHPLVTADNRARIWSQWAPYWDLGKRVLIEKDPVALIRTRFLQALFPGAKFIMITRHPAAEALAVRKWSATGIHSLIHHWTYAHAVFREDMAHLADVLVLSYEGYVKEPDAAFAAVAAFLGVAPEGFDLSRIRGGVNDAYFDLWRREFLTTEDRRKPIPNMGADYVGLKAAPLRWRDIAKKHIRHFIEHRIFPETLQLTKAGSEAQDALLMFEEDVAGWGYSLRDLDRYRLQPAPARRSGAPAPRLAEAGQGG